MTRYRHITLTVTGSRCDILQWPVCCGSHWEVQVVELRWPSPVQRWPLSRLSIDGSWPGRAQCGARAGEVRPRTEHRTVVITDRGKRPPQHSQPWTHAKINTQYKLIIKFNKNNLLSVKLNFLKVLDPQFKVRSVDIFQHPTSKHWTPLTILCRERSAFPEEWRFWRATC